MSPNRESFQDEISFTSGEALMVFGNPGVDGFYYGVNQQEVKGFIPSNMVSPLTVNDEQYFADFFIKSKPKDELNTSLFRIDNSIDYKQINKSKESFKASQSSSFEQNISDTPPSGDVIEKTASNSDVKQDDKCNESATRYFVALFDYDPNKSSPNPDVDVELSFKEKEVIEIQGTLDADGFYKGKLNDRIGLVPCNFVEEIPDPKDTSVESGEDSIADCATCRGSNDVSSQLVKEDSNKTSSDIRYEKKKEFSQNQKNLQKIATEKVEVSTKRKGIFSKGRQLFRKLGDGKSKK